MLPPFRFSCEDKLTNKIRLYGIWQKGLGWVKAYKADGKLSPYATNDKEIAVDVARRIGEGARVEYIDDALAVMEEALLRAEYLKENRKRRTFAEVLHAIFG
jgi:hypothetical protein